VVGEPDAGRVAGRLVSLGGLLTDLVVRVEAVPARGEDALARDFSQRVGGSFAVLAAAARLGMPVALAGVLGDDGFADAARAALAAEGVEHLFPEPRPRASGVCIVMVDAGGERTMVTVQGVESRMTAADFAAVELRAGDIVYLSGYELLYPHGPALVDWIERARPESLIFDPGPLVATISPDLLRRTLRATAWLSLNATESATLSSHPAVDGPKTKAGVEFSAHQHGRSGGSGGGTVVRDGAQGCVVTVSGGEEVRVAAFPARVVDTTGAGDTHVGAFVAALARGLDPVEACRWANLAASVVVASAGQASPPDLGELKALLEATRS
jgi:sugar/nucleoside kinase (ribokinase family)